MTDKKTLAVYFEAVRRVPVLSHEEELHLLRKAARGDVAATQRIIEANQRLVVSVARRYLGRRLSFLDLVSEGNLGLMRAIQKFDPARGCKLATYAVHWIRQSISRAILEKTHTIRIPVNVVSQIPRDRQTANHLAERLGRPPSFFETSNAMRTALRKATTLDRAEQIAFHIQHLPEEDWMSQALSLTGVSLDWDRPHRRLEAEDDVSKLLKSVARRERDVLNLRYGLLGGAPLTLQEVGQKLNLTRARIGQIEAAALSKMSAFAKKHADYLPGA